MPNPGECSVCNDPRALDVNEALVLQRQSLRAIAGQFGISKETLRRHREHLPKLLVRASREMRHFERESLVERLEEITTETRAILRETREGDEPDNHLALKAIQRLEKQLELEAEILDILKRQPTVNVLIAPELERALADALYPFPEVHEVVVEAIDKARTEIDA